MAFASFRRYIVEFVCVRKCRLRSSAEKQSEQIGWLFPGETVVVVAKDTPEGGNVSPKGAGGNRLKVLRLKWGVHPTMGWTSERMRDGQGEVLLERLPRVEWSSTTHHETAIAERISELRSMHNCFTHMGTKNVRDQSLTGGRLVLEGRADHPVQHAPHHVSKERQFASAVLGGCGDDQEMIASALTRLEKTPRSWWPQMLLDEYPEAVAVARRHGSRPQPPPEQQEEEGEGEGEEEEEQQQEEEEEKQQQEKEASSHGSARSATGSSRGGKTPARSRAAAIAVRMLCTSCRRPVLTPAATPWPPSLP